MKDKEHRLTPKEQQRGLRALKEMQRLRCTMATLE
jgi:hypothetical protein